jgi:hypothetical protein
MKTLSTILGTVALTLVSSVAVKADNLLAGPIPALSANSVLICSANNSSANETGVVGFPERITLLFQDAADVGFSFQDCGVVGEFKSCEAHTAATVHPSPIVCNITATNASTGGQVAPVRGSLCVGTSQTIQACLQALLDNATSP